MSGHGARPTPLALAQGAAAVAVVAAALYAVRKLDLAHGAGDPIFALGFLVVAGTVGGSVAAAIGLPRLTGNLIAGILAGPQGFALLSEHDVKSLTLVNALALALIALQAGAELTVPTLARVWRGVLSSAGAQLLVVIPGVGLVFFLASNRLPFLHGMPMSVVIALSLLWGTVSFCRSPSVALALIGELRSKGPLTDWSLGIVVLLDVLLLPVFAAALMVARAEVVGADIHAGALFDLGRDLFASLAAGVTFGLLLALVFRFTKERTFVVVVLAYFVTALCNYLGYDTLFTFVVAGFLVTNLTGLGKDLVETSEKTSAGVMVVFFATAGADLDLRALRELWPLALLFFAARVGFSFIAAQLGHRIAKDPPAVRKNGWLVLVSQAGVTIGLAVVVGNALPGIGRPLASLIIAVVAINELVGAVLMKIGIQRAGEAHPAH